MQKEIRDAAGRTKIGTSSRRVPNTRARTHGETHRGGGLRPPPFVDSFMDGFGEAREAQGVLDGSNFVATSLQLCSDLAAADPAVKDVQCV